MIVLGHCSSGKSLLIDLLTDNKVVREEQYGEIKKDEKERTVFIDDFRIKLSYVHPNAYSLRELYGDVDRNGVVNCLIKHGYESLEDERTGSKKK